MSSGTFDSLIRQLTIHAYTGFLPELRFATILQQGISPLGLVGFFSSSSLSFNCLVLTPAIALLRMKAAA
jgi:hypothetical protein